MKESAGSRQSVWLALALGIGALALFLGTRARVWDLPTLFAMDGSEFVIACADLGIDHPPGHPLYLLLGHLLTRLSGSPDAGVILLSVLAGALTLPLAFLGALELTRSRTAALAAATAFGFSGIFWLHASIIEVYALQMCVVAGLSWLELRGIRRQDPDSIPAVLFAFGMAATSNILLSVLLVPALGVYCLGAGVWKGGSSARRKRFMKAGGALALGLLPFLYIPWRLSSGSSFVNDLVYFSGYPVQSLTWYLWYLSGWEFVSQKVAAYGIGDYPRLWWQYLESMSRNLSPVAAIVGLAGLGSGVRSTVALLRGAKRGQGGKAKGLVRGARDRVDQDRSAASMRVLVLVGFVCTVAPVVGYQVPDREVFYLPSFLFAAYLAAVGLEVIAGRLGAGGRYVGPLALGLVLVFNLPAGWRFVTPLTRDDSQYRSHLKAFLALPKDAVVIGYDDGNASRFRYFQMMKGLRPDVAIETFGRLSPRYHGELPTPGTKLEETDIRAGLNMADRVTALEMLDKKYAGRQLFLIFRDEAPAEFPGYVFSRAPFDPRLLVLQKKAEPTRSETPLSSTVNLAGDWFPGHVMFVGWSIKGLDRGGSAAFGQPMSVGSNTANGVIVRSELFELSFVTRRLSHDNREYFGLFTLIDAKGEMLQCAEAGFTAARQQEVMDPETAPGSYRQDAFEFKVPRACPPGPVVLAVKLFAASSEVAGYYKGRPIRKMSLVEAAAPWQGQNELIPLGTVVLQ